MINKPNAEKKICDAALKLAAVQEWRALTLDKIAKATKIPAAQVRRLFPSVNDILPAIVRQVEAKLAAAVGKPNPRSAPRDRLFEVMMGRFDILQKHRRAICNIMDEVRRDPSLMRYLLPAHAQAMKTILTLAGLKESKGGAQSAVTSVGLLAIYAVVLCRWRQDNTPDMAKTMAVLDRSLRHAEKLAEILLRLP